MAELIEKFSPEQRTSYQDSLKYYRDLKNSLDTASDERAIEIARELLKDGDSVEKVSRVTGLTEEHVKKLKNER